MANRDIRNIVENVVVIDGTPWFRPEAAIRVIKDAKAAGSLIICFRAAAIGRNGILPSLADSWNYSRSGWPPNENPHDHAIRFIRARGNSHLFFDVVLREQNRS
jgi:hypothetical protein